MTESATASETTHLDVAHASAKPLSPAFKKFADAWFKLGDISRAYLATHPDCKTVRAAKEKGRVLSQNPAIVAYMSHLRTQALESGGLSEGAASKLAWENEVKLVAFAAIGHKKVPVKEKLNALRLLGDAKGYIKAAGQTGSGVRATFNFRVGTAQTGNRGGERVISVDMDTAGENRALALEGEFDVALPENSGASSGLPDRIEPEGAIQPSPSPNSTSSPQQSAVKHGQLTDNRRHSDPQVPDSAPLTRPTGGKRPMFDATNT